MWPFGDDTVVENTITMHDVASYSFDGIIVVAIIIAAIYYHWRRNARRLRQLEESARRGRIEGMV